MTQPSLANAEGRARNARLNQAIKHAKKLLTALNELSGRSQHQHVDQKDNWYDGRNALEQLTQCFHEANAYNNCCARSSVGLEQPPSKRQVAGSNPAERANAPTNPDAGAS